MKIVSACLCGINCRYDGGSSEDPEITAMVERGEAIPVCPECLGGLPIPRTPSELTGNGGEVLCGRAKVMARDGQDFTEAFMKGAEATLMIARKHGAEEEILKARSPSCGLGQIYDGSFTGTLREGDGVTAALLKRNGIRIISR